MSLIIFTDLDGTLIDFDTYSAEVAGPLARALSGIGVPLVFCSSKTRSEQQALLEEIGLSGPSVLENGSGISIPKDSPLFEGRGRVRADDGSFVLPLGATALFIRKTLRALGKELSLELGMYSDLGAKEISKISGLSEPAAERAIKREFSETLVARHPKEVWASLRKRLEPLGLQVMCGGRFHTVTSAACDKGKALKSLVIEYQRQYGGHWGSVAIGDSDNDKDMLEAANFGYLVQRPDGAWNPINLPNTEKVSGIGPHGWLNATQAALLRAGIAIPATLEPMIARKLAPT